MTVGDRRGEMVVQYGLANLLTTRRQYDEAERLFQGGLNLARSNSDPEALAIFQMGLGDVWLVRGDRVAAQEVLQAAHQGFIALDLQHRAQSVEVLLAQCGAVALDDLLDLVRAARGGDHGAGGRGLGYV